jgi:soluble lytic murein transglycosylase-like protein
MVEARSMLYKGTVESLLNPETNIYWGTAYLDYCIEKRKSLVRGISGYNTGNVEGNPPFNASYVEAVTGYANRFRYLLNQEFPGYATIFPKETWLRGEIVSTV